MIIYLETIIVLRLRQWRDVTPRNYVLKIQIFVIKNPYILKSTLFDRE